MLNISTTQQSTRQRNTTQLNRYNTTVTQRIATQCNATNQTQHNGLQHNAWMQRNIMDYNATQHNGTQHKTGNKNHAHMLNKPVEVTSSSTKKLHRKKNCQKTLPVYRLIIWRLRETCGPQGTRCETNDKIICMCWDILRRLHFVVSQKWLHDNQFTTNVQISNWLCCQQHDYVILLCSYGIKKWQCMVRHFATRHF